MAFKPTRMNEVKSILNDVLAGVAITKTARNSTSLSGSAYSGIL